MYRQFFVLLRFLIAKYKRKKINRPFFECYAVTLLCSLSAEFMLDFIS